MFERIHKHVRGNIVGYIALILALGGSAYALPGRNTVDSADIINGQVKAKDIGPGQVRSIDIGSGQVRSVDAANDSLTGEDIKEETLSGSDVEGDSLAGPDIQEDTLEKIGSEPWHNVGAPGEPVFWSGNGCLWGNFNTGAHNGAGFFRDEFGVVHLKGLVDADDASGTCDPIDDFAFSASLLIFHLPEGYRPAAQEVFATVASNQIARIDVLSNDGSVRLEPGFLARGEDWVSLDGLTFRCAPSGTNGCP